MRRWTFLSCSLILSIAIFLYQAVLKPEGMSGPASAQGAGYKGFLPLVGRWMFPLVLNAPTTLIPPPGPCPETYWYPISTSLGADAYLTLNFNSAAFSTNSAEWRPDLPIEGFYRVEAFIPAHDPITFCKPVKWIEADTAEARYVIHHAGGTTWKVVSQRPLADQWLDLGVYLFQAGSSGYVELSDLNSEPSLTSTVSFSAVRFTYQPAYVRITLPFLSASSSGTPFYLETQVRNQPAFDNCNPPSIAAMQNWWENSPYYIYNVYLGGAAFASGCSTPDAVWLAQVKEQGWAFIPTWVGPQAPCYAGNTAKMSSDPAVAYQQGREEADAAVAAAVKVGLVTSPLGRTVIYYDLEGYGGGNASQECRQAVRSFITGWVQRLKELGYRTGVYGGSCSSNLLDLAFIANVPDNIWAAQWYQPYQFDPNASVFGLLCVPNSLWANHQRIRQYAGPHSETWGGKTITIDSSIADGEVAVPGLAAMPAAASAEVRFEGPAVLDWGWLTSEHGWVLTDDQLLWTSNGGAAWQAAAVERFAAASFLDASQGWAAADPESPASYPLYRTLDGGQTWQKQVLPLPEGEWQPLQVNFFDEKRGWIVYRALTSSAFSRGLLLTTADGGQTWKVLDLPGGEKAAFNTPLSGWMAAGERLYHTQDGGVTWQTVDLALPELEKGGRLSYRLPVFSTSQEGLLPVIVADAGGAVSLAVYASRDGGSSWELQARLPLEEDEQADANLAVLPQGGWVLGVGGQVYAAASGLAQGVEAPVRVEPLAATLPGSIVRLSFLSPKDGWAVTVRGSCLGEKLSPNFTCRQVTEIWKSSDGGVTWQKIDLSGGVK